LRDAVERYHRLLEKDPGAAREQAEGLREAFRREGVTFAGEPLPSFVRPHFVARAEWDALRERGVRVMETAARVGRLVFDGDVGRLCDFLGTPAAEAAWVAIDPGPPDVVLSRLDAFLTPAGPRFIEINSDAPAGFGYGDRMARLFRELPVFREFAREVAVAYHASDEGLVRAFHDDKDIHRETAALLFGVSVGDVQEQQRGVAKTINYSIAYGISPFGLSKRLGIPRNAAAGLIDMYFKKYSGVARYFDEVVQKAKGTGYVETLLGRRRYVPDIRSENRNIFEQARRIAINTPIQGTAADLIKKAMVIIDGELEKRRMRSRMLIQVHDELVFETPEEEKEELGRLVKDKMENAIVFDVPIRVNVSTGKNWEEAH